MAGVATSLDDIVGRACVCGDGTQYGGALPSNVFRAEDKRGDGTECSLKGAEASLEPHLHIVALDEMLDGRFVLTNLVSNEKASLPEGVRWQLLFDGDGFGVCV